MNADDVKFFDEKFKRLYDKFDGFKDDTQEVLSDHNSRIKGAETDISWVKKIGSYFAGIVSAVLVGVIVFIFVN